MYIEWSVKSSLIKDKNRISFPYTHIGTDGTSKTYKNTRDKISTRPVNDDMTVRQMFWSAFLF